MLQKDIMINFAYMFIV